MADRLDMSLNFGGGFLLLENEDNILLETGDFMLLESIPISRIDMSLRIRIGGNIR